MKSMRDPLDLQKKRDKKVKSNARQTALYKQLGVVAGTVHSGHAQILAEAIQKIKHLSDVVPCPRPVSILTMCDR